MAIPVDIIIRALDQATGEIVKVQRGLRGVDDAAQAANKGASNLSGTVSRQLTPASTSLVKTMGGVAGGFIAAQVGMQTFQTGLQKTVGAAMAYERQMAEVRALTGATKGDTDKLTDAIRRIQREVPKSSAELGAGAYFILSSGIESAADAAKVLEIAAKASEVGLGETAVVADALTTVLNAYQMEAGQAGRVTDVLMQAVKDGKAEADSFAGVLGRVVPIASQMGISFEEVAANMATFTRLGVSAEEAATGLRGVMTQIIRPSDEARERLAELGLTFDQLREQIKTKGLAAVLIELVKAFDGNQEAIADLFPDVRGLTAVLATAGVQVDDYAQLVDNANNATGNLDAGMAEVSDTVDYQLKLAVNDLNVELEKLGADILPVVAKGLDVVNVAMDAGKVAIDGFLGPYKTMLSIAKPVVGAIEDIGGAISDVGNKINSLDPTGWKGLLGGGGGTKQIVADAEDLAAAANNTAGAMRKLDRDLMGVTNAEDEARIASKGLTGEIETVAARTEEASKEMEKLFDELMKVREQALTSAIKEILPTDEELGMLEKTTQANAEFWESAKAGTTAAAPVITNGFDVWRQRVADLAADYEAMPGNLGTILEALKGQHVTNIGDIMGVIQQQGPQFAADFAQWFRDDPLAAATTVRGIMPGLIRQAAIPAIQDVLTQVGTFNSEWKIKVVDALNALPPEKRVEITATVDPEFWLAAATAERIRGTLATTWFVNTRDQFWREEHRALGGAVNAGQAYWVGERGMEMFVPRTSGEIIPNHALGGIGGSTTVTMQPGAVVFNGVNFSDPIEFNAAVDRFWIAIQDKASGRR